MLRKILCLSICVYTIVYGSIESSMKQTLKEAMTCTLGNPPRDPVIALSPARFLQALALHRKNAKEWKCSGTLALTPFKLEDPRTWDFCAAGECDKKLQKCLCYSTFTGSNCERFYGTCWLVYCKLYGCDPAYQDLVCSCDQELQGKPVTSSHYWYNEGLETSYRPPGSSKPNLFHANAPQKAIGNQGLVNWATKPKQASKTIAETSKLEHVADALNQNTNALKPLPGLKPAVTADNEFEFVVKEDEVPESETSASESRCKTLNSTLLIILSLFTFVQERVK